MPTIRAPLPNCHSALRRLSELSVLLLIAVLLFRTWYIEGLVVSCRVTSGSMAETLLGSHREVVCEDCGYRFACDAAGQPVRSRAVCLNCGYDGNRLEALPEVPGDAVLIHKSLFRLRRPRRWEVVAFRHPQRAANAQIKRVVGLPGEKIQICHGDVGVIRHKKWYIQRKGLLRQRALAILVHDASFQPTRQPTPPPRWRNVDSKGQWAFAGGVFAHPADDGNQSIDWLEYRHWRRLSLPVRDLDECAVREQPVTDLSGYNQILPRREEEVRPVTDLMLSLRLVEAAGKGLLVIRISDGGEQFQVRIDPSGNNYDVLHGGRPLPSEAGELPPWSDELLIEVSLFDQQLLLAFDGEVAVAWAYDWAYDLPLRPDRQPTSRLLAVGSQGLRVKIRDVRVYRDVYYTHPVGLRGRRGLDEPFELAEDEYFVLGDNSPVSEDSRTWPAPGAVSAKLLLGKPLAVHFPVRLVHWWGWTFQVPDPAKIRYIR